MSTIHAVIMAGGSGTRFWPASRKKRPKQFLPLAHGVPLLEATVRRLSGLCTPDRIWIVTNPVQARALPKVMPDFPREQILIEPEARDTAPCVALATAAIAAKDPNATMILLPADHLITPVEAFTAMLQRAVALAKDDKTLVTFGIVPDHAATGYGYIECGAPLDNQQPQASKAVRFREKPDRATAEQFVQSGNFLWTSGIFVWSIPAIREAMTQGNPELGAAAVAMLSGMLANKKAAVAKAFRRAPKTSIDYAVMEKAQHIAVVRANVKWDDVGSFPALTAVGQTDAHGNTSVLHGGARSVACESEGNIIYAEGKRAIALFGVKGLVVVAVGDAVMVCPKDRASDLKKLVSRVEADGLHDLL